jgi:hypothetical protein
MSSSVISCVPCVALQEFFQEISVHVAFLLVDYHEVGPTSADLMGESLIQKWDFDWIRQKDYDLMYADVSLMILLGHEQVAVEFVVIHLLHHHCCHPRRLQVHYHPL